VGRGLFEEKILKGGWTVSDPQTHQIRKFVMEISPSYFATFPTRNEEFWEEPCASGTFPTKSSGERGSITAPRSWRFPTLLTCLSSPADEAAVWRSCGTAVRFSDEELFLHRADRGSFLFKRG